MRIWTLLIAAALVCWSASAAAQFTTVIVPPRKEQPAPVVANVDSPAADTAVAARMTDMKAWVDSAAVALAAKPDTAPADSVGRTEREASAAAAPQQAEGTKEFREGAPAPDTATPLPLLILAGVSALMAGAILRRRRS